MDRHPKITVISPVYNGEKYIANLIESLKKQTFKDFEFLLIDDGSTDNTINIAKKKLKKTNIKYKIINQPNGGQSKARNTGIKNATGDYIVLIDSDDTIQSNYLNNLYKAIKSSNSDVAFCNLNRVNEKNIFEENNDSFNFDTLTGKDYFIKFILHEVEIGPVSLIIKRKYLNELNLFFNEVSRYSEEYIFICQLLYNSCKVTHLKQRLYNYCLRNGSVSTGATIQKIVTGFNEILKSNVKYENDNCIYCQKYRQFAMPRWILATARFSSKNFGFSDYKKLLNDLNYKNYIKKMKGFPDKKAYIAALLLNMNLYVAYLIFRFF